MKKVIRTFHLLLVLSLVLLPIRAVMAGFSVISMESEVQVNDHHPGVQSHHADMNHEVLTTANKQTDELSTDCPDHNMTDCEACALHFTLKKDTEISESFITPGLYADYNVPLVTLVLSGDIRPPIS